MLCFSMIPTPEELKQAAAIERRRQNAELRKCRINDPRTTSIGIDKKTLDIQIKEKKQREDEEKRLEAAYLDQKAREDQVLNLLDRYAELQKQKRQDEIARYRLCKQKFEDRREFDLNDPHYVEKATMCSGAGDEVLGIASMQRFEGEDLCKPERLRLQAEQKRAWFVQQCHEKKVAEEERLKAEAEYMKALVARDQRVMALQKLEKECRKRIDEAEKEQNRVFAEQAKSRRKMEEMQDYEDNQAHNYNVMTSDMMTENVDCGISSLGPGRIIPSMYRGMNAAQKTEVVKFQIQQIEEKKAKIEEEKHRDAEWLAMANDLARSVACMDKQMAEAKRILERQLKDENKRLGEIQKQEQKKFEEENAKIKCDFFDKFGTSAR